MLLLLGAPLHWPAKGFSLIVGIALGTAALSALATSHGAVGLFATNHLTELVWGAAGVLLIVFSFLPRVGGKPKQRYDPARAERPGVKRLGRREPRPVEREPTRARTARAERESLPANGDGRAVDAKRL